jgi:hypothetical protein
MSAFTEAARNSAENAVEFVATTTAHTRMKSGIRRTVMPIIENNSCYSALRIPHVALLFAAAILPTCRLIRY